MQRPTIQLSRQCGYHLGGNLTNQATVTQYNAVQQNTQTTTATLEAPQPDAWSTDDEYLKAYQAAFPDCDVTFAPAPDSE